MDLYLYRRLERKIVMTIFPDVEILLDFLSLLNVNRSCFRVCISLNVTAHVLYNKHFWNQKFPFLCFQFIKYWNLLRLFDITIKAIFVIVR